MSGFGLAVNTVGAALAFVAAVCLAVVIQDDRLSRWTRGFCTVGLVLNVASCVSCAGRAAMLWGAWL